MMNLKLLCTWQLKLDVLSKFRGNNVSIVELYWLFCSSRIVNILMECNATVKGNKMTPLHLAVKQASVEYPIVDVVKALLKRQTDAANVDSRDINEQTPLHYAAVYCNDHLRIIELLVDRYVGQIQI